MTADNIIRHAIVANRMLNCQHMLAITGKVDITDGLPWDYDWAVLSALSSYIPKMVIMARVEGDGRVFGGDWLRKSVPIFASVFGTALHGTLTVTRHGPALDEELQWQWTESEVQ